MTDNTHDSESIENIEKVSEYLKVIDNNRHMFIMLFKPGCPPCRAAMPEWLKIPKAYKGSDVLRVGEYDLEKLLGIEPRLDVQGFPTFVHLFKNNEPEYYSGERNVDGFTGWIDSIIADEDVKEPIGPFSFVHFGCWNKDGCSGPYSESAVTQVINNLVQTQNDKHDFFVIAGDNYYPKGIKPEGSQENEKRINLEELASGFECLKQLKTKEQSDKLNPDVNVLMGNHDIAVIHNEENDSYYTTIKDKHSEPVRNEFPRDGCIIYDEQKKHNISFDFETPVRMLGEHTVVIFINSSIVHESSKKKDYSCAGDINVDQYSIIKSYYDNYIKIPYNQIVNVIVVGHHPIISDKLKNGSSKVQKFNQQGITLINRLYSMFMVSGRKPVNYYLCADLHFYESGILTITNTDDNSSFQVKQIVSGTGGAELDTPTKPGTLSMQVDNIKLELVSYFAVRSYGYVIVEDADNNGQLNINFNPVHVVPPQTGAGRRRVVGKQKAKSKKKNKTKRKSKQKKRKYTRKT